MNIDLTGSPLEELNQWMDGVDLLEEVQIELKKLLKKVRYTIKQLGLQLTQKLSSTLKSTGKLLRDAFTVESLEDQQTAAALYGQELAAALYRLQASFAGLKAAMIGAAAPLVQVLLPAIQLAVQTVTDLANSIGYVLRMLFFGAKEAEDFSQSLEGVGAVGTKVKRTLASFDQINRLGSNDSSGGGFFSASSLRPLTGIWKTLAEQLAELLAPLRNFDLTPAAQSLERLKAAIEPLTRALFSGLEWAWNNIFLPLAQWTVEELLPVFLDTLSAALQALAVVIEELKPYFIWLWENFLKPLASWAADQLIAYLQGITDELNLFSGWVGENQGPLGSIVEKIKGFIESVAQAAAQMLGWKTVTEEAGGILSGFLLSIGLADTPFSEANSALGLMTGTLSVLAECFGSVSLASSETWSAVKEAWGNAWTWLKQNTVDPTFTGVKGSINGVIGLINGMLSGMTSGVNNMSGIMNKLKFTVPDWIPVIGGKTFSFGLQSFTAPQVPYLAQGAVLPANKPFMAVVGDQKHGTNIEAPLTTIQEAVAVVLGDQVQAMMAGFQALLEENRRLRTTVEGIELGDSVIGAAAERYNHRMQLVRGGY